MTTQAPPSHAAPPPKQKSRLLLGLLILFAFFLVYALSLFGFHLLGESAAPLKAPDLNAADDTVVLVRIEELKTVANRLGVKVLVYPQENMWDPKLEVLKTDTAVRMDPPNDAGDLAYPAGKSPAMVATTVEAHGDPEIWPFDSYETDTLSAEVMGGSGDDRKYKPARVEVAGKLEGWDVRLQRVGEGGDSVIITLERSKAPLIFDLGICLVLFALATMALAVVVPMALGKRKLVPPFGGWFAALLFAVIPIRNFLPGAPPPGAWIDQALVIWVLIALVAAMMAYMFTWYKRSD